MILKLQHQLRSNVIKNDWKFMWLGRLHENLNSALLGLSVLIVFQKKKI